GCSAGRRASGRDSRKSWTVCRGAGTRKRSTSTARRCPDERCLTPAWTEIARVSPARPTPKPWNPTGGLPPLSAEQLGLGLGVGQVDPTVQHAGCHRRDHPSLVPKPVRGVLHLIRRRCRRLPKRVFFTLG